MSAVLTTNVDQRLLRTTKFPPEFNAKVDLKKVNVQLIKAWVGDEIARILKSEDDVVVELVNNILDSARHVRYTLQFFTGSTGHVDLQCGVAEHQRTADPAHGLPRERRCDILPGIVEAVPKRTRQSSWRTERTARSQEGGTRTGEGRGAIQREG